MTVAFFLKAKNRMMTEERQVHPDCRNASNPFHQCSNYCFEIISEAMEGLNTSGRTTVMPGITKIKDDGFGPTSTSPITPLSEDDQIGNLVVDLSALLASNDDDEAEILAKLTKKQRKMLRTYWTYKEALKAHQTTMVQEKKMMEHPEGMAQEKQPPAPVGRDVTDFLAPVSGGEKFVNDFLTAFPPLTYHGDKGGEEIYAPPVPVKAEDNEDMSEVGVGAYPDHVVLSIANERDRLKAQLQLAMEEITKQKMMYQNQRRQAELWRAKYKAIANAPPVHEPASHGQDSGPVKKEVR